MLVNHFVRSCCGQPKQHCKCEDNVTNTFDPNQLATILTEMDNESLRQVVDTVFAIANARGISAPVVNQQRPAQPPLLAPVYRFQPDVVRPSVPHSQGVTNRGIQPLLAPTAADFGW